MGVQSSSFSDSANQNRIKLIDWLPLDEEGALLDLHRFPRPSQHINRFGRSVVLG